LGKKKGHHRTPPKPSVPITGRLTYFVRGGNFSGQGTKRQGGGGNQKSENKRGDPGPAGSGIKIFVFFGQRRFVVGRGNPGGAHRLFRVVAIFPFQGPLLGGMGGGKKKRKNKGIFGRNSWSEFLGGPFGGPAGKKTNCLPGRGFRENPRARTHRGGEGAGGAGQCFWPI